MEDGVDKLPDSYFSKAAVRLFDRIDHAKDGTLTLSSFFDLIETLGEGFNSEDMAGHLREVYPNESGSLDHFIFVRWYVDKEVSLKSLEEAERFVGWG